MLIEIALTITAALAWSMVVWHIGQGRGWSTQQQRIVFWAGIVVLAILIRYLTR